MQGTGKIFIDGVCVGDAEIQPSSEPASIPSFLVNPSTFVTIELSQAMRESLNRICSFRTSRQRRREKRAQYIQEAAGRKLIAIYKTGLHAQRIDKIGAIMTKANRKLLQLLDFREF